MTQETNENFRQLLCSVQFRENMNLVAQELIDKLLEQQGELKRKINEEEKKLRVQILF